MRKFIIPLLSIAVMLCLFAVSSVVTVADNASDNQIPDDAIITYGYLKEFKETLKQEIISQLMAEGGIGTQSVYVDVTAVEGQIIYLHSTTEVIYRGGGAAAITSSCIAGDGIIDMSRGTEIFSGQPLEYGHIYYCGENQSSKAILVTGDMASFTIRGDYEIG